MAMIKCDRSKRGWVKANLEALSSNDLSLIKNIKL